MRNMGREGKRTQESRTRRWGPDPSGTDGGFMGGMRREDNRREEKRREEKRREQRSQNGRGLETGRRGDGETDAPGMDGGSW